MDLSAIRSTRRLLLEVDLVPLQGARFQPTGFPNLGHATYARPGDGRQSLLVDSAQSMANRLEDVYFDGDRNKPVDVLDGMPFIRVTDDAGKPITNSLLESHRTSSAYILEGEDTTVESAIKSELGIGKQDEASLEIMGKLHRFLFAHDPNALLHGVFFAKTALAGGRLRVPRAVSSFIEATGVSDAPSGGVKIDIVDPGSDEDKNAKKGFGNVPFTRVEYTAKKITAYFNLDVEQIMRYDISDVGKDFLVCLALWKILRFLQGGLRLRTACDLRQDGDLRVVQPVECTLPSLPDLEESIRSLIQQCEFKPFGTIRYRKKAAKGKKKAEG